MKNFVLIQPGCDLMASDIVVFDSDNITMVRYILERGGDEKFFTHAAVGDAMPFDRERVVLCVGNVWGREE